MTTTTLSRLFSAFLVSSTVALLAGCPDNVATQKAQSVVGPAGPQGSRGPTGPTGAVGVTGATGDIGSTGTTGSTGVIGSTGQVGATGVIGATGATGVIGLTGVRGMTGATGAQGLNWRGPFASGTSYVLGDAVSEGGSSYVALVNQPSDDPSVDVANAQGSWALLAQLGATGSTGVIGATGARGAVGATGVIGVTGATGVQWQGPYSPTSPYVVSDAVSYEGSSYVALVSGTTEDPATSVAASDGQWALVAQNGATGAIGITGMTGAIGVTGTTGIIGVTGATGLTWAGAYDSMTTYLVGDAVSESGSSYVALISGAAGNPAASVAANDGQWGLLAQVGAIGVTGFTGAVGSTGMTGAQGIQGDTGAVGVTGFTGAVGSTGMTGAQGVQGVTGAQGLTWLGAFYGPSITYGIGEAVSFGGASYICSSAAGCTGKLPSDSTSAWDLLAQEGAAGIVGATGVAGATGATGTAGAAGVDGKTGVTGATGLTGATGTAGAAGTAGVDGKTGATGATGLAGPTGAAGAQGPAGAAGAAGAPGSPGAAGQAGAAGAVGPAGATGPTGAAGAAANISGTTNAVVKFTGTSTGGNSEIYDDGTHVGIGYGVASPALSYQLQVTSSNWPVYAYATRSGSGTGVIYTLQNNTGGTASTWAVYVNYYNGTVWDGGDSEGNGYFESNVVGSDGRPPRSGGSSVSGSPTGTQYSLVGAGLLATTIPDPTDASGQGRMTVHATTTPEAYLQDFGQGQLNNGVAHIALDPKVTASIHVDEQHPLRVFVQTEDEDGESYGVFVKNKSAAGFDVIERRHGRSNTTFQWQIVGNRGDESFGGKVVSAQSGLRFEPAPQGPAGQTGTDPTTTTPRRAGF